MPVPRTDLDKPDSVPNFTLYSISVPNSWPQLQ